ncbi:MAG: hypothetical protein HZC29_08055 [Thaumarchaeota archaeon]|nr:hypothetical protein [Nitrososphaerota archaeon]
MVKDNEIKNDRIKDNEIKKISIEGNDKNAKKRMYIGVNIDWSKSFVDENGGFYCGATQEQKDITVKIMEHMDLVIYTTDFHSINSLEFKLNGGLWPLHNVAEFRKLKPTDYGLQKGTTLSPEQTKTIDDAIDKSKTGIIVPKHVYYQDGKDALFTYQDIEDAFREKIVTPEEFLREDFTFIISPKTHFDATRTVSEYKLPKSNNIEGSMMPDKEYTVFDIIAAKYPTDKYEIVFVNTGVVENICRHYISTGQRQLFPNARIINLEGATTELAGIGLGFEDKKQVKDACRRISMDIGVEYMNTEGLVKEIEQYRAKYVKLKVV